MVIVAFRKETHKLVSICLSRFSIVREAKQHIEDDAAHVLDIHSGINLGWIKPNTLDYYCIELKNGIKCYWQYFKI